MKKLLSLLLILTIFSACFVSASGAAKTSKFTLTTSAFKNKGKITVKYTYTQEANSKNVSIPLSWTNVPKGTKSFAVIMYDLHPIAGGFVHWVVANIPASASGLKEGASKTSKMPKGSQELVNNFSQKGYGGASPPPGSGNHEYKIIVYALKVAALPGIEKDIMAPQGYSDYKRFVSAMNGKILAKAEISGFYGR